MADGRSGGFGRRGEGRRKGGGKTRGGGRRGEMVKVGGEKRRGGGEALEVKGKGRGGDEFYLSSSLP